MNASLIALTMAVSMLSALLLILMPLAAASEPPGPGIAPWAAAWALAAWAGVAIVMAAAGLCRRVWP